MLPFVACVLSKLSSRHARFSLAWVVVFGLLLPAAARLGAQKGEAGSVTPSRLMSPIDEHELVTLHGNVRQDLAAAEDLGPVEDEKPVHLYLLLRRSTAQQADLDNLLARQQEPGAPEYHKWLTPQDFGVRFGASPEDISKLSIWLESQGFRVRRVMNNLSVIDFAATASQIRQTFRTELHYYNIAGGKYAANAQDPQIPAALAPVVAGILGLVKIPPHAAHTTPRPVTYNEATHRWSMVNPAAADGPSPAYTVSAANNEYDVSPQDLYTIYNINPIFSGGDLAATATVAVIEETDMNYGTVDATTGVTTGGDVVTFRNASGVAGTLNMHVYHGYGSVTCNDPGIVNADSVTEASLDAEWINATAPSANEIYMSCDSDPDLGILSSMEALVDNNLSDVMSMSYSDSELNMVSSDALYNFTETVEEQAATQGQTIFVCAGDSGSDDKDQNTTGTATSGINVSGYSSNLVTVAGGLDFSDFYDAHQGGVAESTYWSATNTKYEGSALGYIPETTWNGGCASSIGAVFEGEATLPDYCAAEGGNNDAHVVGGGGGISTHFAVPSWQTGISGYSNAYRSSPDLSGFASDGIWGHSLIYCDSQSTSGCFAAAGGTSFVSPYLAGVTGLLVTYTGSRQGLLNPALYALAKAQYTASATKTACYSNGQTSNTGVTMGLPAAACIFNDVTTSNNDVPCAAGTTDCYVNSGAAYGLLSLDGATSLGVAYPSTVGFDSATGLGSVNVNNLITKWNSAFGSTTALSASPTSLTSSQSTELTATVTGKAPTGYVDTPPAITGTATFKAGTTALGNCTLSSGTCKLSVSGSALQSGANSVTATFAGSGTYPASTSSIVTVTVTETSEPVVDTPTFSPAAGTYSSTRSVTIADSTTGATIYYTTNGTTPTTSSTKYTAAISVSATETIKAIAVASGYTNSAVASASYTIQAQTSVATPTLSPSGGTFTSTQSVTISDGTTGATIYYTTNGTTPTTSSTKYTGAITVSSTETIEAIAVASGYSNSAVASATYTITTETAAVLTSPKPGSTFTGLSATFSWSAVSGATAYSVVVGTTGVGSNNLGSSGVITATSATFGSLPSNGETIYVQLSTEFGSTWVRNNYTYTAVSQSVLKTPTPSSTLTAATATFAWTAITGATGYELSLGSTGVGSSNVWSSGITTATSATSGALPVNGETIYARLSTDFNGTLVHTDYTYTAATLAGSAITSPAASSTLKGPNLTFTWTAITGATDYELIMGSTGAGSSDLANTGWRTATSWLITNIPTNGEKVYVRLTTNFNGSLVYRDYTYTATTLAAFTAPKPNSVLPGTTATFTWNSSTGATGYVMVLGTTGVGSNNLWSSGATTGTSVTFGGLPVNGETIYARMTTIYGTYQRHADFTYTAATQASLTAPAPGSKLTSSTPTFSWKAETNATGYELFLGSTGVGSDNLWSSGLITTTSVTSGALPVNGEKIYARLYTDFNGSFVHFDYTYTAVTLSAATLTTPAPSSTLAGTNVTFTWTSATQATQYELMLGSTGVGSSNLANTGWRTATSWEFTGLPNNGETIYARLTTNFNGTKVSRDYTYTAYTAP